MKTKSTKDVETKYERKSTEEYMQKQGSSLPHGPWLAEETMVLLVLMRHASRLGLPEDMLPKMYNDFAKYSVAAGSTLREKSTDSIQAKVKNIKKDK